MVAKKLDGTFGGSARNTFATPPIFTYEPHTSPTAIRAEQLIRDIATLYCTKPRENPTTPVTQLRNPTKWGVYHVALYQYDIEHPELDEKTQEAYADPDLYDGLRMMAADMLLASTHGFECSEKKNATILHFKTIDDLVDTCKNLLVSEDCQGHPSSKQILLRNLNTLINEAVKERRQDGFDHPALGYLQ